MVRDFSKKRVLAIGGAHLDRRGRLSGTSVPGASNPGEWREEAGGGVFNAARILAALGHRVRLVAPRGGDAAGLVVSDAAAAAGIEDTPLTFLDRRTPTYTAILEADGNLIIALADMALYDLFSSRQVARRSLREAIDAADAVLTDANLPRPALEALGSACARAGRPLFAIAVSPAKVGRLRAVLPLLAGLFMNEAEAGAITGNSSGTPDAWPRIIADAGLPRGVVTRGGSAAILCENGRGWRITPPLLDAVDVTGAGDALAAGFIDAFIDGATATEALRAGVAAGGIVVRSASTMPADFDRARLEQAIALVQPAILLA